MDEIGKTVNFIVIYSLKFHSYHPAHLSPSNSLMFCMSETSQISMKLMRERESE